MKNTFDFIKKFKIHISSGFLMVLFTALGLYYSFSFVPGRQTYSTLSTNLVYVKATLLDENEICDQDPNLKNRKNMDEMNKLQNKIADLLNTIDASAVYDKSLWKPELTRQIREFTQCAWDQYFFIKKNNRCPNNRKTKTDLQQWVNGIISQFPHYWFF